ncbi:MAG TPA: hypothetical protein VM241_05050 [Candidatus Thermoplasmatota archaeon]|nr:hypothetical protein [Candidatus Thermoplasmatota archaeon]
MEKAKTKTGKRAPKPTKNRWTGAALLRTVSALGVGFVAAPYALGFLAWSVYANTSGLGPLPLTPAQYIPVGILAGIWIGAIAGLQVWVGRKLNRTLSKGPDTARGMAGRLVVEGLLHGLIAYLISFIFLALCGIFSVFSTKKVDLGTYPYWFGLASLGLFFLWVAAFRAGPQMDALLGQALLGARRVLKRLPATPEQEATPRKRMLAPRPKSFFAIDAAVTVVALLLMFSLVLLPAMRPSYGGALPRHAYLDLAPGDLSATTLTNAFGNWTPGPDAVVRTPPVTVFYYDSGTMLVKAAEHDSSKDRLIEISRSLVRAITWID